MKHLMLVPYTFVLMNWAAMRALYCFLKDHGLEEVWVERRASDGRRRHRIPHPTKP